MSRAKADSMQFLTGAANWKRRVRVVVVWRSRLKQDFSCVIYNIRARTQQDNNRFTHQSCCTRTSNRMCTAWPQDLR